jgi:hypothetical protein
MAIQFPFTSSFGTTHDQAYARIDHLVFSQPRGGAQSEMKVYLNVYASSGSCVAGARPMDQIDYEHIPCDKAGDNSYLSQSYEHVTDLIAGAFIDV